MKIIDLLNKIANGEEVPKKIKYNDKIFIYDGFSYIYENKTFNEYNRLEEFISYGSDLKDEVEILEEEKKIPEKIPIGLKQTKDGIFNTIVKDDIQYELNEKEEIICKKIHEIIDYLKSKGE